MINNFIKRYYCAHKIFKSNFLIKTEDIKLKVKNYKKLNFSFCEVRGGEWDLDVTNICNQDKYKSIIDHFEHGVPWEETPIFKHQYKRRLSMGEPVKGCFSLEELIFFYQSNIDNLYLNVKKKGVLESRFFNRIDPMYINLGRSGEILWGSGGNHRLAIAKSLGIEYVPVRVRVCHEEFYEFIEGFGVPHFLKPTGFYK